MERRQKETLTGGKSEGAEEMEPGIFRRFLAFFSAALFLAGMFQAMPVHAAGTGRPTVQVCGDTVGIYMETDGVMVISTSQIPTSDGLYADPAANIIKAGDYICSVNGTVLTSKRQLTEMVDACGGKPLELLIRRDGQEIPVSVQPVLSSDGTYKIGVWVRDNIQGIGTLTYVGENGTFGALGHAISDVDTGEILNLKEGELYLTEILSVVKGQKGVPGELQGVIHYEQGNRLGSITANSGMGIHGTIDSGAMAELDLQPAEIAWKEEVTTGPVQILASIDGNVCAYEAEITKIDDQAEDTNKSFTIRVTDDRLLGKTGGIVQGMSGSPILQNGRLVGAVTHVFVADASCGYGIFIENMLNLKE